MMPLIDAQIRVQTAVRDVKLGTPVRAACDQ